MTVPPVRDALPIASFVILASFFNVALAYSTGVFAVPLFMDTVGTIIITILFGPIAGLITATVSHVSLVAISHIHLPFILCQYLSVAIVCGLHRSLRDGGFPAYLWMGFLVGMGNAVLGNIISYVVFSGVTSRHIIDEITLGLLIVAQNLIVAVIGAGTVMNLADKGIAAVLSYVVVQLLIKPSRATAHMPEGTE